MISLVSNPMEIYQGDSLKIELTIDGKINEQTYYGKYFNLNIKKNGTNKIETLYPLRYNLEPLIWEINPFIYNSYGTFNVIAIIQDGPQISTCTFIVLEQCTIGKINICNNLSSYNNISNIKNHMYKKNISTGEKGEKNELESKVQKPNIILYEEKIKEELVNPGVQILLSNKVQKNSMNVNPNK